MFLRKILSIIVLLLNLFLFYVFTEVIIEAIYDITKVNSESINLNFYANSIGKFLGGLIFYIINTILFGFSLKLFFKKENTNIFISKIKRTFNRIFKVQIVIFGLVIIIAIIFGIIDLIVGKQISITLLLSFSVIGILIFFILNWSKNKLFT